MKSLNLTILITALALTAGSVGLASSTNAEAKAATAAACDNHIGVTRKAGNVISGFGSQARNCGTRGQTFLTIQRYRWFGWENLVTKKIVGPGHDVYVRYNCAGTGTHTYRTIHTGRTVGNSPLFRQSNHIRVTCR
jgi:hypothetical protein